MLVLYFRPGTGSFAPQVVLEEAGADYDLRLVGADGTDAASVHPFGWVPSLQLADGTRIIESAAILTYLADAYPAARMAPALGTPERALYGQWIAFLAANVYESYAHLNHPERFSADPGSYPALAEQARRNLATHWGLLDAHLARHAWLAGPACTAADLYMAMLAGWHENPEALRAACPNVARIADAVEARPAVARVRHLEATHGAG